MLATSLPGRVLGATIFLFFLHCQGGGLQLARSSLPSGDMCSLVVALRITNSAHFRWIPYVSQRVQLTRNSCWEISGDVTRAPNLRGFPCRPARAYCPGNPLCTFREQNTRHAARGAPHMRPHGNPSVPNSNNTCLHFSHPRGWLVSDVERFRAGSRRHARAGRARNAPWTSYTPSREPGAVAKLTLCGPPGSPLVSPV